MAHLNTKQNNHPFTLHVMLHFSEMTTKQNNTVLSTERGVEHLIFTDDGKT